MFACREWNVDKGEIDDRRIRGDGRISREFVLSDLITNHRRKFIHKFKFGNLFNSNILNL